MVQRAHFIEIAFPPSREAEGHKNVLFLLYLHKHVVAVKDTRSDYNFI